MLGDMMTIQEAINRAFNLVTVSIVGLAGFAFLPEVFLENDFSDKIDDSLLFILSLVAIGWYLKGRNRFSQSVAPVVFMVLALLIKIMGAVIEFADPESLGDDMGGLILFVLATGLVLYQYRATKRLIAGS